MRPTYLYFDKDNMQMVQDAALLAAHNLHITIQDITFYPDMGQVTITETQDEKFMFQWGVEYQKMITAKS